MSRWRVPALIVSALACVLAMLLWWLDPQPSPSTQSQTQTATSHPTSPVPNTPTLASTPSPSTSGKPPTASSAEQTIEVVLPPSKDHAIGDDFVKSGLPKSLWDAIAGLEARAPNDPQVKSLEAFLKRPLTETEKKELIATFKKQHELAEIAIGRFRQKLWTEDQALKEMLAANAAYKMKATKQLAISDQEFEQIFGK